MAGDLAGALFGDGGDYDLVIMVTHPDIDLASEAVRHGVLAPVELDHRDVGRHGAGDAEHSGVGTCGNLVQMETLLGEHLVRDTPRGAVLATVHLPTEGLAGITDELRERRGCRQQVGICRDEIGLSHLHESASEPPFDGRIGDDTAGDGEAGSDPTVFTSSGWRTGMRQTMSVVTVLSLSDNA